MIQDGFSLLKLEDLFMAITHDYLVYVVVDMRIWSARLFALSSVGGTGRTPNSIDDKAIVYHILKISILRDGNIIYKHDVFIEVDRRSINYLSQYGLHKIPFIVVSNFI